MNRKFESVGVAILLWGLIHFAGCSDKSAPVSAVTAPAAIDATASQTDTGQLSDLLERSVPKSNEQSRQVQPGWSNVAEASGVHFQRFSDIVPQRYFLPEVMGGGVAAFDYDGDGNIDLYATDGCQLWDPDANQTEHVNRLYRNQGDGRFFDATRASESGDNRFGQGCAAGDFNGDGFPDLYVTNYGRNTLLVNNGDGTFADVTLSAGVGDEAWGTSTVWLDANCDSFADLYVANYINLTRNNHRVCTYGGVAGYCGPGQWEGVADILYLNLGDGRFQIAAAAEGAETIFSKGLAVAACDFNEDGQPEIYVANDMTPNFMLTRTNVQQAGQPLFQNVAEAIGCAVSGDGRNEASMGVACADFDGDGQVDIFLTHYYQQKNTLYRNLGSFLFEDNSHRSHIAATSFESLGFGTVAMDFDHDGDEDLFIANGHVLGSNHSPNAMQPQLLENDGAGSFADASARCGEYFQQLSIGRGTAKGDINNDGKVDLVVNHIDQPMAILLNETESPFHFIGIELLPIDRICPAGGRLIVSAGEHRRVIPIVSGGSYLSSSDPRIVIGLNQYDGPVDISVVWAGRQTVTYHDLKADQYWCLCEGSAGRAVQSLAISQDVVP